MPEAIIDKQTDDLAVNTIKFLAVDGVQKANSGHPGMPMGAADYTYALWMKHLRYNPKDPAWPNRDRFILSAGHGSMLLYSMLHLSGYDMPMEQLKQFRQWGSHTPGHPEYDLQRGIETTTGPLGQGISNAVGMAMARKRLAALFNKPGYDIIDHRIYVIASDGDLEEGISHESCSLAGHLGLGSLIVLYDDNHISIEGDTELAYSDNVAMRFESYGWYVQKIDGHDRAAAALALTKAGEMVTEPPQHHHRAHPHRQRRPHQARYGRRARRAARRGRSQGSQGTRRLAAGADILRASRSARSVCEAGRRSAAGVRGVAVYVCTISTGVS